MANTPQAGERRDQSKPCLRRAPSDPRNQSTVYRQRKRRAHKGQRRALRTTRRSRLQIVVEKVFVTFVPSMMLSVCWLVFVSRASISTALERARPQRVSEQNDCSKNYVAKLQDLRQRRIIPEYNA